ncbi:MAG: TonB-dependent receptor [Salinivirgaceae bacterium]|jgi:predicted small secreted protein|nr:TonB-dependent receptor [Salinivirgaceae bacterium]
MRQIVIVIFLLFTCMHLWAQKNTLSGIIYDARSGETLIGATVLIKGINPVGAATDINGFFSITGIQGKNIDAVISFIGYTSENIKVSFTDNKQVFKEIKLKPQSVELGQINIIELSANDVGDREIETSQHRLSPKSIKSIPTARNDVFRAIKFLPGIEATEPLSPLVSVRGSDPGENLIMLDGVTIYNPYHFISSSGIFNMQTVKNIDVLAGGFGAEYGGRNASVIHISTKDGTKDGVHGEVHPSTVESRVFVEFPLNEKTTMMVAGRVNYDVVANFIMQSNNYFYDFNLSLTHRINARNRVDLKYFGSKDHTSMNINSFYKYMGNTMERIGDTLMADVFDDMNFTWQNQWKNNIGTAIWKSVISPKLYFRVQAYLSLHSANNFSEMKMQFEEITFNTSTRFKSKVSDYTVKSSLNYKPLYWNELKLGAEYSSYLFENVSQIDNVDGPSSKVKPDLVSLFAEDKIKWGGLIVRPGVRLSNFNKKAYKIEPRINLVYKVNRDLKFKAAYGKYYQYIISMNTQELEFNQFLDYYYPLNNARPSLSYHYIAGVEKRISKRHQLSADIYYKNIARTYTFDLLQSQYEAFALSDKVFEGSGETYGLELLWKGQVNRLSGWLSYTLSSTNRSFPNIMDGKTYLYDYDHLHNIKGVVNFQATKRISYSADFMFQSGVPRSVENSMQMFFMYEPISGEMLYSPQYTIDQKNSSRMPWVMSINLGLEKKVVRGFGKDISDFFNAEESYLVVNVRNILFLRRNVNYYIPFQGQEQYIPMGFDYLPVVSAGYTIKF